MFLIPWNAHISLSHLTFITKTRSYGMSMFSNFFEVVSFESYFGVMFTFYIEIVDGRVADMFLSSFFLLQK